MFSRKAQSTLEYVIILTAIVAVILIVAGTLKTKVKSGLENIAGKMEIKVNSIEIK